MSSSIKLKNLANTEFSITHGDSATALSITSGVGSPEGVVVANVGSMYLRTDGGVSTTLYVKQSGVSNTGWTAK